MKYDWQPATINGQPDPDNAKKLYPKSIQDLNIGGIRFEVAEQMKKGIDDRASVSIAFNKGLLGKKYGEGNIEDIRLTKKITARLNGDTKFEVVPLSTATQLVLDEEITVWNWTVRPLKSGTGDLQLVVSAAIEAEGIGYDMKDIETFRRQIRIRINPRYTLQSFLEKNWQWLITLVAGSGVTFSILKALGLIR